MSVHHLKLSLHKTQQLFPPGKSSPFRDLSINIKNSVVSLAQTVRNPGGTLDDQRSFAANTAATTHSCKFVHHNIRKIRLFLGQKETQVLFQAVGISRRAMGTALPGRSQGVSRPKWETLSFQHVLSAAWSPPNWTSQWRPSRIHQDVSPIHCHLTHTLEQDHKIHELFCLVQWPSPNPEVGSMWALFYGRVDFEVLIIIPVASLSSTNDSAFSVSEPIPGI